MVRIWGLLAFALCIGAADAQTIKIGVITDRVGVSKPYSEPATEGVIFGADEINRRGGLLGRKIELLVEDDQSRPDISAALAEIVSVVWARDAAFRPYPSGVAPAIPSPRLTPYPPLASPLLSTGTTDSLVAPSWP